MGLESGNGAHPERLHHLISWFGTYEWDWLGRVSLSKTSDEAVYICPLSPKEATSVRNVIILHGLPPPPSLQRVRKCFPPHTDISVILDHC